MCPILRKAKPAQRDIQKRKRTNKTNKNRSKQETQPQREAHIAPNRAQVPLTVFSSHLKTRSNASASGKGGEPVKDWYSLF